MFPLRSCPTRSGRCPAPSAVCLRSLSVFLGFLFSLFVLVSAGSRPARALAAAPTYQVTTLADAGAGSLRAAINSANGNSGSTITFKPGLSGTILLASGLPALGGNMTITGPGAALLAVDGQSAVRPFSVNYGVTAVLSGLTIQNGASDFGGGVLNAGTLTLTACALTGNSARQGGAGIYNSTSSTASLTACTLTGNSALYYGGGIASEGDTLTLTGCTLTGNSAINGSGGGIYCDYSILTLTDDIFYGDSAGYNATEFYGSATVSHCDIAGYDAAPDASGNFGADPLFVNAANGDLHLSAGSPCIHVGSALPPGVTDQDGNFYASPSPSIGAYEYASYTVTNLNDGGAGSLRAAITSADSNAGSSIGFKPGLSGTILLASGLPALTTSMTITGPGAALLAVDGSGKYQPFSVNSGVTAALSGLIIQNGNGDYGGGVDNSGTLTLTACALTGNNAGDGGGVLNAGTLTLTACALTGNKASDGGGIYNAGTLTLTACALTGNRANLVGAGIYNSTSSTVSLTACTLTGNSAQYSGGGVVNAGTLTLTDCTLTGNSAYYSGGSIYNNFDGTLTLTDDILYGDSAPTGSEITGTVTASHCDIQQAGYAGSSGNLNANPRLSALGYYGGPTKTFALLPGSPCLGAGIAVSGLTADPRGIAIPQNGRYDIGAFESQGFTVTATGGSGQSAPAGTAFAQRLTATVTANDPAHLEPVYGGVVVFTAPAAGASGALSGSPASIGSGGVVSVTATANGVVGSYTVAADTGTGSVSYSLANTQAGTSVALTSSINPSQAGQFVTFQATVTGQNPSGSVTFTIDGTAGTPIPLSYGSVTSPAIKTLSADSHTVTATYSGDTNNKGSVSGTLTQTVIGIRTTTFLQSSLSPSQSGQAVTLTAIVESQDGSPPGFITFYDGSNALGTASLDVQGLAGFLTTQLQPGTHSLTAKFSGADAFAASTSAALSQTVTAPPAPTLKVGIAVGKATRNAAGSVSVSVTVSDTGTAPATVTLTKSTLAGHAALLPPAFTLAAGTSQTLALPFTDVASGRQAFSLALSATSSALPGQSQGASTGQYVAVP